MLTGTTRDRYHTLLDAESLIQADDRPAIIMVSLEKPPETITRASFARSARQFGAALLETGIAPGDLVIIAHTQTLESIYAFWGALMTGAIPSMFPTLTEKLDPNTYMANLAELVRLSGVKAVLTTDDFAVTLKEHVSCPVYGSTALLSQLRQTTVSTPAAPDENAIAFLQHSSGTTGLQKGVALSHRAVLNQLASYSDAIGLNSDDVVVSWLPLYHDMGLIAGFLLPLVQGVPLVLMSPFEWVKSPALLFKAIDQFGGTLCWLPNFAYNHCARRIRQRDLDGLSAASMRLFINCSEPVYHESHSLFLERFASLGVTPEMLAVSYAMAENTFAVTQTPLGEIPRLDIIDQQTLQTELTAQPVDITHPQAAVRVSCGRPIRGVDVRVVDMKGDALPERHIGELMVRSDSMLAGYYHRPELQPFQAGWYQTGDRGYLAGGEVYVIGRTKDLIINAGKNIYPQDIEAVVNTVDGVIPGRAVAFGVPDAREGTELIAIIAEVETEDAEARAAIGQHIRLAVARQTEVSVNYLMLVGAKWLIKTSSGKIARGANRDKWLAEQTSGTTPAESEK